MKALSRQQAPCPSKLGLLQARCFCYVCHQHSQRHALSGLLHGGFEPFAGSGPFSHPLGPARPVPLSTQRLGMACCYLLLILTYLMGVGKLRMVGQHSMCKTCSQHITASHLQGVLALPQQV